MPGLPLESSQVTLDGITYAVKHKLGKVHEVSPEPTFESGHMMQLRSVISVAWHPMPRPTSVDPWVEPDC